MDCKYLTDNIRCYEDGRVERLLKGNGWTEINNSPNQSNGYNQICIGNKNKLRRHRIIAHLFKGLENIKGDRSGDITKESLIVDHIDGDKLNNSADNLRITTQRHNMENQKNAKGACFNKRSGMWLSYITRKGITYNLGSFYTFEEAHCQYLFAKEYYHNPAYDELWKEIQPNSS